MPIMKGSPFKNPLKPIEITAESIQKLYSLIKSTERGKTRLIASNKVFVLVGKTRQPSKIANINALEETNSVLGCHR